MRYELKSIQNGSYDLNHNDSYEDLNKIHSPAPTSNYRLTSLPLENFAQYDWPPSIYQAAQSAYSTPLPLRQRLAPTINDQVVSEEEPWQMYHARSFSYLERSRDLGLPHMDDSTRVWHENLSAVVYPNFGASSTTEIPSTVISINSGDAGAPRTNTSK